MDPTLKRSKDDIRDLFFSVKTRADVADLLEVSEQTLIFLLYRNNSNYSDFQIPKRRGGFRTIHAPVSTLKIVQRKLNYVLSLVFRPRDSVHGFVKNKDIKTNASVHFKTSALLNIDLENFFESISIQRVIGLFMHKPYEFPYEAAVVLAQICCSPYGFLPQGAPTSPVISNMISSRLDGEIKRFLRSRKCLYTRYADDLTISSLTKKMPEGVVEINYIDGRVDIVLNPLLRRIIESNGFAINESKTKYRNSGTRQEITGLVINQKVNVRRRLMKQVRAMLYSYKSNPKNELLEKIRGKLNFIRQIRGSKDRAFRVLNNEYREIMGLPREPLDVMDEVKSATWLVEVDGRPNGTAFIVGDQLVTCDHVVRNAKKINVCRWENGIRIQYSVSVIKTHQYFDLSILKFDDSPQSKDYYSLSIGDSDAVIERQKITLVGFPHHITQTALMYTDAKITGVNKSLAPLFLVSLGSLISGMSGGPALNSKNEVIGINVYGSPFGETERHDLYGVRPVNLLKQI